MLTVSKLDLEMSFATGEDVMRTVESIVSDLTQSLSTNFAHVMKGDEVYLALKRVQVWQALNDSGMEKCLTVLPGTYECRGGGHPAQLHKAPIPSYHVRGSHDEVWYRQA